jgi:ferredoxin
MNISRKDFFKKSLFSMGEALLSAKDILSAPSAAEPPEQTYEEFVPVPSEDLVAVADNQECLAKNSGCFSCVERCEQQAILVVMGEGIRIDEKLCNGCGTCEYICPVSPKAVKLKARTNK